MTARHEAAYVDAQAEGRRIEARARQAECIRLRDEFAMAALPALLARHRADLAWGDVAPAAYRVADAMMAERMKVKP